MNNYLKVKDEDEDKRVNKFLFGNKLMDVLGVPEIKEVTTMDELRTVFKIKTLEVSAFQKEYMENLSTE